MNPIKKIRAHRAELKAAEEQHRQHLEDFGYLVQEYRRVSDELIARRVEDVRQLEELILVLREKAGDLGPQ